MLNKRRLLLLVPGMKIMQKIKFLHKILVLTAILLLPIVMLSYFLHIEIKKVIDFAEGERQGVYYILPLSEILTELTEDVAPTFNNQKVTTQIQKIDKIEEQLGKQLNTNKNWQELKDVLQKPNSSRQVAIDKTLALITTIGDNSGLVLDPDIDSYYMMDAAIVKYPDMLNKTNKLTFLTLEVLGKPSAIVDDQLQLSMTAGAVRSLVDGVKVGVQTATKANSNLKSGLELVNESEVATTSLLKTADSALRLSSIPQERSAKKIELLNQYKSATNKNVAAYKLYLKQLDELLAKRIEVAQARERVIFAVVITSILIAAYLLLALYYSMQQAIGNIFAGTLKFAEGDWREAIALSSVDEFADIANSLNSIRSKMQLIIREILQSAEHLAASSEELTASSAQSAQAATQVATSINEVAVGSNKQLEVANDTTKIVEQMSTGIQQLALNTNQVAEQSTQANNKAKEGGLKAEQAINQMTAIEKNVQAVAESIVVLNVKSKDIGQIVNTISGIANQTNLLALNAAIEAARAGEQGRGFAVVADEVRKLAEQSKQATERIAKLIEEIQFDTEKTTAAMQSGTREVKMGVEVINSTGATFQEIMGLVSFVSGQIRDNSVAIQQMATSSKQIVGSVNQINELNRATAAETQSVSAATEEQLASMEEIATSSQALASLAQDLHEVVAKFRV